MGNCFTAFLCAIAGICLGALLFFMEIVSKTFGVGTSILGCYGVTSGRVPSRKRTEEDDHIIKEMAEEIKRLKEALKAPGKLSNWMMPTRNMRLQL